MLDDSEDALRFAEANLKHTTWWAADLRPGCIAADETSCPICRAKLKDTRCPTCAIAFSVPDA